MNPLARSVGMDSLLPYSLRLIRDSIPDQLQHYSTTYKPTHTHKTTTIAYKNIYINHHKPHSSYVMHGPAGFGE